MKDTDDLATPYESVFLEMEEFHRTESPMTISIDGGTLSWEYHSKTDHRRIFSFEGWHPDKARGIPTTCTLN